MELNKIINGNSLEELRKLPNESVDLCVTSPPYYNLRDYGVDEQFGQEESSDEYISNLILVFNEIYRILKKKGSCWVNIDDVYAKNNFEIKKGSLMCIPDRFKIEMIKNGWLCRNEIIWHKPNAMPSSAKNRFNNDYEKFYFFTKDDLYYFETQYEECKTKLKTSKSSSMNKKEDTKYLNKTQESSVRQGMNKERGNKLIEVRTKLPTQEFFVSFLRRNTNVDFLFNNTNNIKRTTIEHWFRKDEKGFSYPRIEDWNKVKDLLDDYSNVFEQINEGLTYVEYETDDINKNIDKGRIKRAIWDINTKPFKGCHFAPYPKELIETPIKSCCPKNGIVIDPFNGSGTTCVVAKKINRNYIGIDLNKDYCMIAEERLTEEE